MDSLFLKNHINMGGNGDLNPFIRVMGLCIKLDLNRFLR